MQKGEIWMADLNSIIGTEQSDHRPVIIIFGNAMNSYFDMVITCPLSSKLKNFIGNVILEPAAANGLTQKSEIIVFQVRIISKVRLTKHIGHITTEQM
jgi:mRNA interferase MazF